MTKEMYTAFKAKDTRFDGHFFIGVKSTEIYCRPICRAKLPKAENCTYYKTAAEAESAGYRPCLLCRPELAPGMSIADASASLSRRAALLFEETCGSGESLESLSGKLGCTARHLRRVFAAEFHVSPLRYLQTCRLLLAKNLLTSTNLSIIDTAMAAGFGSLRRFNAVFMKHYRMSPTALRRQSGVEREISGNITLPLGYRPPYLWEPMMKFFADHVADGVYYDGQISVSNCAEKNTLNVTVSAELLPKLPQVLAYIRRLFDVNCDPDAVYEVLADMNRIRPGLCVKGMRLPGCFEPDYFPADDEKIQKTLPQYSSDELIERAESWRPWRGYATMNLWNQED